jgi:SAM-dependent methyltransferase
MAAVGLDRSPAMVAEARRIAYLPLVIGDGHALPFGPCTFDLVARHYGRQRKRPLLGRACDFSISSLRTAVARAARDRMQGLRWSCTLFPLCPGARAPLLLGDVIGLAAHLRASGRLPSWIQTHDPR